MALNKTPVEVTVLIDSADRVWKGLVRLVYYTSTYSTNGCVVEMMRCRNDSMTVGLIDVVVPIAKFQ